MINKRLLIKNLLAHNDENSIYDKKLKLNIFDDSKIQNLVNAYLSNPPRVSYENIPFPHLPSGKVVGLVSIRSNAGKLCSLRKNIWKYAISDLMK